MKQALGIQTMKLLNGLLLFSLLLLTGCDTMNWQQYRISNMPATSQDTIKLKSALKNVSDQVGLQDKIDNSKIPGTLAFYSEPDVEHFRVDLGARLYEGDVIVDLMAGFGPTPQKYNQAKSLLESILSKEFDSRLSSPKPFVPVK